MQKFYRPMATLLGAILFLLAQTNVSLAATDKQKFGKWLMHCSESVDVSAANLNGSDETPKQVCALFQSVAAKNRPNFGLTMMILKEDPSINNNQSVKPAGVMKFLVPLGVLLPTGIALSIEGQEIGKTAFIRCAPNGCTAVVSLPISLLNKLQSSKIADFTIFITPEDGLTLPVELTGLREGFTALSE